jgi:hypothetical protein
MHRNRFCLLGRAKLDHSHTRIFLAAFWTCDGCFLFLVLSCRNQFVSEYLSESPVVSFRLPYRRRNVRLATRALVRLMSAEAPAKDKARVAKEAAENPEQVLQFALKNTYQRKYVAHAHPHTMGASRCVRLGGGLLCLFGSICLSALTVYFRVLMCVCVCAAVC